MMYAENADDQPATSSSTQAPTPPPPQPPPPTTSDVKIRYIPHRHIETSHLIPMGKAADIPYSEMYHQLTNAFSSEATGTTIKLLINRTMIKVLSDGSTEILGAHTSSIIYKEIINFASEASLDVSTKSNWSERLNEEAEDSRLVVRNL